MGTDPITWNSADADIRAEALLIGLMRAAQLDLEKVLLLPTGGFKRPMQMDLDSIRMANDHERGAGRLCVRLNRNGVYDGLPEGVFHQPKRSKPFAPAADALEEIKRNNAVEEQARAFLAPIDHELLFFRLVLELNEHRLTSELLSDRTGRGVRAFWSIPRVLDEQEMGRLLKILPVCHAISGDPVSTGKALEEVLRVPVALRHQFAARRAVAAFDMPAMEHMSLGVDSVLDGTPAPLERGLVIELGPMDALKADSFAPGQRGRAKLELLLDLFLPADQMWELQVHLAPYPEGAILGGQGGFGRLGFSSVLI